MDDRREKRISKYLARHLRHDPARIGIRLDPHGWAGVDELLAAAARDGFRFSRAELEHVDATNDKRRYAIDGRGQRPASGPVRATRWPLTWDFRPWSRRRSSSTAPWPAPSPPSAPRACGP
jgi:RNA:NAD 2'-phosphotransferase (TPT1/KptA family)